MADLNADHTNEFVINGEKKGTGHEWTCKCCDGKYTGHKRQLAVHIAGKKFSMTKRWMCGHAILRF